MRFVHPITALYKLMFFLTWHFGICVAFCGALFLRRKTVNPCKFCTQLVGKGLYVLFIS